MDEVLNFINASIGFLATLFSTLLVFWVIWIIGVAVVAMARNQVPRWDSIGYITVVLLVFTIALQFYPVMVVKSVRVGLESARPELKLLQDEIQSFLPNTNDFSNDVNIDTSQPVRIISTSTSIAPTQTPAIVSANERDGHAPSETQTPYPTYTPYPIATSRPLPTLTITPQPTIDNETWTVGTPPPTPSR